MLSFTGMPPILGFMAKLSILKVLIDVNQIGYATFAIVLAVVGAYYYLRVIKVVYFDQPSDFDSGRRGVLGLRLVWSEKLALSVACLLVLGVGIYPTYLLFLCEQVLIK